jgi:hypothetical protein
MWHYLDDSGNSRSSQELGVGFLEDTFSDGEQSAPSSGPSTRDVYLLLDSRTASSRVSQFGTMSSPSTESLGEDELTLSAGDSPAKTSALPEKVTASTGSDPVSGGRCPASLAKYDPATRSWKTAQRSLFEDSTESLETFPRWGSTAGGELFQQQTLVRPTLEKESGSWPTPDANMGARGTQPKWTPIRKSGQPAQYTINQAVRDRFQTPSASEDAAGIPNGKMQKMLGNDPRVRGTTPEEWAGGSLNPKWVEWLMGWPLGWTDLKPLETDKFQQWQQQHSNF